MKSKIEILLSSINRSSNVSALKNRFLYAFFIIFSIQHFVVLINKNKIQVFFDQNNNNNNYNDNSETISNDLDSITDPALKDAINCVGTKTNAQLFLSKSYEERKKHTKWINDKIRSILPKNMKQHCWVRFCGPWLEDIWMGMEKDDFHTFGPFVPLFVPWVKMWIKNRTTYIGLRDQVLKLLKTDFFYITLCTNSAGIEGRDEDHNVFPDNLLIISGGGRGHIPTLIFMHEHNPKNYPINDNYKYDLMFIGTDRYKIRQYMIANYSKMLGDKFYYKVRYSSWKKEYEKSKFIAAPRGYGRNSYRLCEVLQTGRVPVYIYNDIIWLPYYDSINWSSFSIITHYTRIQDTIKQIKETPPSEIRKMREKIRSLYSTHFTVNATFNHIKSFLLYGFTKSDLRCAKYSYITGLTPP